MGKIRLSVDDGCASDVRVADLAVKYDVETIFYWPVEWHSLAFDNGYEPLKLSDALRISEQFEIGSHTITHRHLTKINSNDLYSEIFESKYLLERIFEKEVTKFAPPRGYSDNKITEMILKCYDEVRFTKQSGLVHIHPNSGANNNRPWQKVYFEKKKKVEAIELFMHSWELDRFNMWSELERFLREEANSGL